MKKVILITGSTKGIGLELMNHLLKNYIVIGLGRSYPYTIEQEESSKYICDITKRSDIKRIIRRVLNRHGRIDVLINNAGVIKYCDVINIREIELKQIFDVNLKALLTITQTVLPSMIKNKNGHIINILSTRAITGAPFKGAYAASKFGARGLMESLRAELRKTNIKVTNICPGKVGDNGTVSKEDISKSVDYILSLSKKASIRDLIIGGQL